MMNAPKLLPRIASRAGISQAAAARLWHCAVRETSARTGARDGAEFHAAAVAAWLKRVEDVAGAKKAPRFGWIWRHQRRMAVHALTASYWAYRWWDNVCHPFRAQDCTAP